MADEVQNDTAARTTSVSEKSSLSHSDRARLSFPCSSESTILTDADPRSTIFPSSIDIMALLCAHRQTHPMSTTVCRLLPLRALGVVSGTHMTVETQWYTYVVQKTVNPTNKSILYDLTVIVHYFDSTIEHVVIISDVREEISHRLAWMDSELEGVQWSVVC